MGDCCKWLGFPFMLQGAIYRHIFVIDELVDFPQALFLCLKCMPVIIDDYILDTLMSEGGAIWQTVIRQVK